MHADNTTAATYINKQGGQRSTPLMEEVILILLFAKDHLDNLTAMYSMGNLNFLVAD